MGFILHIYILMYNIEDGGDGPLGSAEPPSASHKLVLVVLLQKTKRLTTVSCCLWQHILLKAGFLFTARGTRVGFPGSPVCKAESQSCPGRRWPCPSEQPVHSWTPQRTGGPQCWTGTPSWRCRLLCRPYSLPKTRNSC